MPSARVQWSPWLAAQAWLDTFLTPREGVDEMTEARELLAYWEGRARRLPRWALMRRREARDMARRWRERVRAAEQARYGAGVLGAATQLAVERRMPTTVAYRGRQALRLTAYAAGIAAVSLLLVLAAAAAVVAETILSVL
jgi:hypothetical protein